MIDGSKKDTFFKNLLEIVTKHQGYVMKASTYITLFEVYFYI